MENKNILKKYDEVLLNHNRLTPLIEDFHKDGKNLAELTLSTLISAYIHERTKFSSTHCPTSINMTIDLEKNELSQAQDAMFYGQITFICNQLGISPTMHSTFDRKIIISLY